MNDVLRVIPFLHNMYGVFYKTQKIEKLKVPTSITLNIVLK